MEEDIFAEMMNLISHLQYYDAQAKYAERVEYCNRLIKELETSVDIINKKQKRTMIFLKGFIAIAFLSAFSSFVFNYQGKTAVSIILLVITLLSIICGSVLIRWYRKNCRTLTTIKEEITDATEFISEYEDLLNSINPNQNTKNPTQESENQWEITTGVEYNIVIKHGLERFIDFIPNEPSQEEIIQRAYVVINSENTEDEGDTDAIT